MVSIQKDSNTVVLALGGNIPSHAGNPSRTLTAALGVLVSHGFRLQAVSRYFRTPSFPAGAGPVYVNACAIVAPPAGMALYPDRVLAALHAVEAEFGRIRKDRWAARGLDLDLIAMGGAVLPDAHTYAYWKSLPPADQLRRAPAGLILPHPRMAERGFVLIPLADILPAWRHPVTDETVIEMLAALPDAEKAAIRPI
ncbi:2-amino-4-hydroxy-6-hydroxymethyldihydropteridine diphosphokinase [Phaeovulum sp.]|uniref:2-amino-4-hydroxy-6- hydroxymethyldihydropteridine diphosphokinase n=1 Tax=Phaeovulum sp. TaxID=2934796 RepID=UPI0039E4E98E